MRGSAPIIKKVRNVSDPNKIVDYCFGDEAVVQSTYVGALRRWLEVFPAKNVLLLTYEELVRDVDSFVKIALSFVGADTTLPFLSPKPLSAAMNPSLILLCGTKLDHVIPHYLRPGWHSCASS